MTSKLLGFNANSCKTVKDMDFKFGVHVFRDSPDVHLKNF